MFPATVPELLSVTLLIPFIYLPAAPPDVAPPPFVGALDGKEILSPEPLPPDVPLLPAAPNAPPLPPAPPAPAFSPPADPPDAPDPAL